MCVWSTELQNRLVKDIAFNLSPIPISVILSDSFTPGAVKEGRNFLKHEDAVNSRPWLDLTCLTAPDANLIAAEGNTKNGADTVKILVFFSNFSLSSFQSPSASSFLELFRTL